MDAKAPGYGKNLVKIYFLLLLVMLVWGGTFIAGRLVSFEIKPLTAALWRFILSTAILAPLALKKEGSLWPKGLGKKDWFILLLLGATGMFGYSYFFIKGLKVVPAGRASVIVALNPSLTFIGTFIFFNEKMTARGLLGFFCALSGAAVAITRGRLWEIWQGQMGWGEILILACAFCWAAYSLLGKVILGRMTPLMSTTWACITGVLLLLPFAFIESGPLVFLGFSLISWLSLAFLGMLGTSLGFTLYYWGIVQIGPKRASVFINLVPVFAIMSSWLFLDESVDASLLAGLMLVLAGITLIQHR